MATLAVVIVSWNVCNLLRRCLRSVESSLAGSGIAYEIIVVDNASADGTPAMLRAEFPQVRLIAAGGNLGFAGGNNLALRSLFRQGDTRHETRRHGDTETDSLSGLPVSRSPALPLSRSPALPLSRSPALPLSLPVDYVLLLNPDTEAVGAAIPRLVRELEERPELLVVGPQLRYPDGRVQSSRRRFPTRGVFFWESTPLERLWPENPWARRYHCADQRDDEPQAVGWLVGAALLVRSAAIARAGLLDEGFFMYSEELEWQMRLQIADCGLQIGSGQSAILQLRSGQVCNLRSAIRYVPDAVIIHYEGKSSEQALAGRHLNFQRSKLHLARQLYGPRFAALLRAFLRAGYVWELCVEAAKLLLGHRRELRAQRVGIYAAVLSEL